MFFHLNSVNNRFHNLLFTSPVGQCFSSEIQSRRSLCSQCQLLCDTRKAVGCPAFRGPPSSCTWTCASAGLPRGGSPGEKALVTQVLAAWVWAWYLTSVGPGSSVFKCKGQQDLLEYRKESLEGQTQGRRRWRPWRRAEHGGSCGQCLPEACFSTGEQLTACDCASSYGNS